MRRRDLLAAPLILSACGKRAASEEFRIGATTGENEADRMKRFAPLADHLTKVLERKVSIRNVTDYAGVVEALRSKQVEVAILGPAAYVQAWKVTKGQVEPLVAAIDPAGDFGYYSILVVRTDRPWQSLADVKGKILALADPNSTSGYQAPWFYLRRQGIEMSQHFSKLVFSGSHESSILGLLEGTYDVAATFESSPQRGNIQRMESKKMIPADRTRIIWKSPQMPPSPWVARSELPMDLKLKFKDTMLTLRELAPQVWNALSFGREGGYREVSHADYLDIIAMVEANVAQRRPGA